MNNPSNITSLLDQIEIRNLISLDAPLLGDVSITNIGLYLSIAGYVFFIVYLTFFCYIFYLIITKNHLDSIHMIVQLILTYPVKPHKFIKRTQKLCIDCGVTITASAATIIALSETVTSYLCLPIAIATLDLLNQGIMVTYPALISNIEAYLSLEGIVNPSTQVVVFSQIERSLGVNINLIRDLLNVFIVIDVQAAILEGTLYGTVSDNLHTIINNPVALVEYQNTGGVRFNWLSRFIEMLDQRMEWFPGDFYVRLFRNFRG